MAEKTRFKVNINTGEIEIEGSQKFVEEQVDKLPSLINSISRGKPTLLTPAKLEEEAVTRKAREKKVMKVKAAKEIAEMEVTAQKGRRGGKVVRISAARRKAEVKPDNEFVEYMKNYKTKLKQTDYVLLSGYYVQKRSKEMSFRTADISKLLKGIEVKVSNITSTLYLLNRNKKLAILQKEGRTSVFRVTTEGEKYLVGLLKK